MSSFPYLEILKKAYELTRKYLWLWFFGLFIGSTTGINIGGFNFLFPPPRVEKFPELKNLGQKVTAWITTHSETFALLLALALILALLLIILSGWSKAAVIWTTSKLVGKKSKASEKEIQVNFRETLKQGQKYLWQIIGLQVIVTSIFILLLLIFAAPIVYLFQVGAVGRGVVLSLLALGIIFPASIVFRFIHIYGPILIVLYHFRIGPVFSMAFNLLKEKFRESIILTAFLIGLSMLFVLALVFSIILLSVPVGFLGLLLLKLELSTAFFSLVTATAVFSICYVIFLSAGFAVFQHIVWVLAVLEMLKARKLEEREKALAIEPEPAA